MKKLLLSLVTIMLMCTVYVAAEDMYVIDTYKANFSWEQGVDNFYFCKFDANGQGEALTKLYQHGDNVNDRRWTTEADGGPVISFDGMNPKDNNDTGLEFIAPEDGVIRLTAELSFPSWIQDNTGIKESDGDGVKAKIIKNNDIVWQDTLEFKKTLSHDILVNVKEGDKVKFVLNVNGNASYDVVQWWPTVDYVLPTLTAKFGEVQGVDNFYYCAFNNGQETLLSLFPQSNNPSDKRWRVEAGQNPYVAFDGASPTATTDVGLLFVAPIDGQVNLTATMNFPSWIQDNTGIKEYDGNGVKAQILKNDVVVWEDTLKFKQTLSHDVSVLVEAGDKIKFVLNVNGNESYDVVQWWPTVKYVLPTSTSKFGEIQGVDNFYFCQFDGGEETMLNLFPQSNNPSDKRWRVEAGQNPCVAFDGALPSTTTDVGLMYVTPMDGTVNITGKDMTYAGWILSNESAQGNGVKLTILKNDTVIWEKDVEFRATTSHDLVVSVAKGDKIKFIINAKNDNGYDSFVWWPEIKYTTLEDVSALKVVKNEIDENGNYVFSCVNTTGTTHNLWVFAAKKDIDGRLENVAFIPVSVPAYSAVEETESGIGLTASDEISKYIWEAETIRPYINNDGILTK